MMFDEEWDILDRKALGTILLCLAPSVALNIKRRKDNIGSDDKFGQIV